MNEKIKEDLRKVFYALCANYGETKAEDLLSRLLTYMYDKKSILRRQK